MTFPPLIGFVVKNWRILSLFAGLVVIGLVIRGEYKRVDLAGYNRAVDECNAEKLGTINDNIKINQKQNKIVPFAGKRELVNGLRDGSAL